MEFDREIFPVGMYFYPTDSELIDYLKRKICGHHQLPSGIIKELPYLYEYPPELLPIWVFEYGKENEAYYFTHKGKKPSNGEVLGRKKFEGEWKINGVKDAVVFADNKIVGFKTELYLYRKEKKTGWVIIEYRCNPILIQNNVIRDSESIENYVVLHMKFDPDLRDNFSVEEAFSISMEEAKDLDFFIDDAEN